MIYHILPELEPLSTDRGGALAHTVANLMKLDQERTAVCPIADDSWGLPSGRILVIDSLLSYGRIRGRRHMPIWLLQPVIRHIFKPFVSRLRRGDVVWIHNRPMFAAALTDDVRKAGAKLVYHFHDGIDPNVARRCFSMCRPDAVIFVSEYLRTYWEPILPMLPNAYVVHNGADANKFFPANEPKQDGKLPVVLFVGRLNPVKGAHVLVEAIRKLNERGVKTICRMVGSSYSGGSADTPYMQNLLHLSPSNIEFTGHCSATELGDVYRSADVLCCPSVWQEPFGKVNVEAMGCGLPVVASRVGGIPEIAADGGVKLVAPENSTELADALQSIIDDSNLRRQMSRDAYTSFRKHFTWTVALSRYREIAATL